MPIPTLHNTATQRCRDTPALRIHEVLTVSCILIRAPLPCTHADSRGAGARCMEPLAPRRLPISLCFPGARRLSSSSVDVQDDLPDLLFREEILPHRHSRIPRVGLGW